MNVPGAGSYSMPSPDVLEDCLARLGAGEDLVAVLATYPADREALGRLIETAKAMRESCEPPSAAFRASLQVRLAGLDLSVGPDPSIIPQPEELPRPVPQSDRAEAPVGKVSSPDPAIRPDSRDAFTNQRRGLLQPWLRRLAATAIAIALFLASMVAASADSRPGDLLYPVHQTAERLGAALAESLRSILSGTEPLQPQRPSNTQPVGSVPAASDRPGAAEPYDSDAASRRYVAPSGGEEAASEAPTLTAASADDLSAAAREAKSAVAEQGAVPTSTPAPATSPSRQTRLRRPSPTPSPRTSPTRGATPTASPDTAGSQPVAPAPPTAGPVGAIAGHVWGYDRQPRAKWPVSAYPVASRDSEPFGPAPFRTKTDEDGSYRLDNLPPGKYKVLVGQAWFFWGDVRWYPGTWSAKHAKVVTVAPQTTTNGIDVRYERLGMTVPVRLPIRPR